MVAPIKSIIYNTNFCLITNIAKSRYICPETIKRGMIKAQLSMTLTLRTHIYIYDPCQLCVDQMSGCIPRETKKSKCKCNLRWGRMHNGFWTSWLTSCPTRRCTLIFWPFFSTDRWRLTSRTRSDQLWNCYYHPPCSSSWLTGTPNKGSDSKKR